MITIHVILAFSNNLLLNKYYVMKCVILMKVWVILLVVSVLYAAVVLMHAFINYVVLVKIHPHVSPSSTNSICMMVIKTISMTLQRAAKLSASGIEGREEYLIDRAMTCMQCIQFILDLLFWLFWWYWLICTWTAPNRLVYQSPTKKMKEMCLHTHKYMFIICNIYSNHSFWLITYLIFVFEKIWVNILYCQCSLLLVYKMEKGSLLIKNEHFQDRMSWQSVGNDYPCIAVVRPQRTSEDVVREKVLENMCVLFMFKIYFKFARERQTTL